MCLYCKHVEIHNSGFNGFIGEEFYTCAICEESNVDKTECFESEEQND